MKLHHNPRLSLSFILMPVGLFAQAAATSATSGATGDELVKLSEFTVTSDKDKGYGATYSTGATRLNTPIADIPATVVTLNEKFLQDTGALSTTDAVKYVSGMNANGTPYAGQVTIRGFQQGSGLAFRDGIGDNGIIDGSNLTDFATIERVEVIKGPNGVLFGSQVPGGVVNSITKQPRAARITSLKFTTGSYGLVRGEFDTSGAADAKKRLTYRLVLAKQEGETPQLGPNNKFIANPAVTWRPFSGTSITATYNFSKINVATSRNGWFADRVGAFSTFVPVARTFDERDEHNTVQKRAYDLVIEQRLWEGWRARMVGRTSNTDQDKLNYNKTRFDFVDGTGRVLGNNTNYRFDQPYSDIISVRDRRHDFVGGNNDSLNLDLVGNFKLGPTDHKFLAYGTLTHGKNYNRRDLQNYPSISVFRPVYVADPVTAATLLRPSTSTVGENRGSSFGMQDSAYLIGDRLILVGGLRRQLGTSSQSTNLLNNNPVTRTQRVESKPVWLYKGGLVGKPVKGLSLFYNYAETFASVSGTDPKTSAPFKNQAGTTNEGGVKSELFDGRLVGTVSIFNVKLDNFLRTVTDPVLGPIQQQLGLVTSKGIEGDLAYQPTEAITLLFGYGDLTSKDEFGVRVRGVPQGPNYKFFGKYSFLKGPCKGLSAGGGYVYNGHAAGDTTDSFDLPPWETFDAFASYTRGRWQFQLNIYNLADKTYVATAVTKNFVYPGMPRNFRASVGYTF